MKELVRRNSDGKPVGEIKDGEFIKHVKFSRHFFKKYQGWSIDLAILKNLQTKGIKVIRIIEEEYKKTYLIDIETYLANGIPYQEQIVLPLKEFNMI
jgi:hypothetical protein